MNIIQELEHEQMQKVLATRGVPEFGPGDTLKVVVRVIDADATDPKEKAKGAKAKKPDAKDAGGPRLQAYEGVCISRSGHGLNESFTVRKISYGEGVERVFPIYSPHIAEIEVLRRGKVRRAKLYYLRGRRGKAARIFERTDARARKLAAAWKGFKKPKGEADDLTKITGITPELAGRLLQLGCTKYEQIANFSGEDIANVEDALKLDGIVDRNDWIGKARALVTEATAGEVAETADKT